MRLLSYFRRSSSLNLNSSFGDCELLASIFLVSPQRQMGKLEKKLCLLWKISLSLGGIQEHKSVKGGRNKMDQTDDKARLVWGIIVKTKHQSLISLAFTRLVLGATWVISECMIVASVIKSGYIDPSKSNCWKLFWATLNTFEKIVY